MIVFDGSFIDNPSCDRIALRRIPPAYSYSISISGAVIDGVLEKIRDI
jgi:hypothetical protein